MKKRELLSLTLFLTLVIIIIMDYALVLPNQVAEILKERANQITIKQSDFEDKIN